MKNVNGVSFGNKSVLHTFETRCLHRIKIPMTKKQKQHSQHETVLYFTAMMVFSGSQASSFFLQMKSQTLQFLLHQTTVFHHQVFYIELWAKPSSLQRDQTLQFMLDLICIMPFSQLLPASSPCICFCSGVECFNWIKEKEEFQISSIFKWVH